MKYPKLKAVETVRQMVDVFKGYNHNLRIGDGEFYDMKNMTSDHYPVLSPRKNRGDAQIVQSANGIIAKDKLCIVEGEGFVIDTDIVNMDLTHSPKNLIIV